MKQQKFQLQNLYVSPKSKDSEKMRKIYLNGGLLSKTSRNQQGKCINDMFRQLNIINKVSKVKNNMSVNSLNYSDRKKSQRQLTLRRQSSLKDRGFKQRSINLKSATKNFSTSRLNSSTSRLAKMDKSQKSTMLSELQNATARLQKHKQEKKNHEMGKNCRVTLIQGTNEDQHFITVDKIGDIMAYLTKHYPRYRYYKSIPSQVTIDYFLMEGKIDGKFLNGQSLYLKPCGRTTQNSVDQKQEVGLHSFQIIRQIGSGGFSKVFLCRFKQDGHFYAMKVIDKQVIVKNKKKRIIMNERNIMKRADHPFVIDMKFAFQSDKYLVFVMEYCAGGQLFGLIKKHRRIQEQITRFYIIQIFLGLSYLHSQEVVYRDIKPQNILICQNGHVKIADLGLAKPDMSEGQLAYSFCGSPEYMSPQMILQVGHTFPVDYYCMGALLYQLLTGLPPYYSRDPNQIYEAVLSQDLTFPPDVSLTAQCKNLLKGLLCKEPKQRLGSIHGVKQILAHPWFGKNQYKRFLDKEVVPPVNFESIGKVNLDDYSNEQKGKKQLEQVKKQQKIDRKRFKEAMKGFYYDYRQRQGQRITQSKQRTQKSQQRMIHQAKFRRNSSSNNKVIDLTSKDRRKENSIPKQQYLKLQNQQIKFNPTGTQQNSLKKITNRSSRNNLLKHKITAANPSGNGFLKNIPNSEKY